MTKAKSPPERPPILPTAPPPKAVSTSDELFERQRADTAATLARWLDKWLPEIDRLFEEIRRQDGIIQRELDATFPRDDPGEKRANFERGNRITFLVETALWLQHAAHEAMARVVLSYDPRAAAMLDVDEVLNIRWDARTLAVGDRVYVLSPDEELARDRNALRIANRGKADGYGPIMRLTVAHKSALVDLDAKEGRS